MKRLFSLLIGISLLLLPLERATAQSSPAVQCTVQMTDRVLQQQRLFRTVLFGQKRAESELEGAVRYDTAGNAWIKVDPNRWVSARVGESRSNDDIDDSTEWPGMNEPGSGDDRTERQGIFETPGALTTDLLPQVMEAYRAFHCRLSMVCQGLFVSPATDGGMIDVVTPGCAPLTMAPLDQCRFRNDLEQSEGSDLSSIDPATSAEIRTHCAPLVEQLARDEAQMVRLAVSYDAAHRSILQFAGQFDFFLESWKGDVLSPLRQTVSLVHQLSRIPCFLAQCSNE